MTDTPPHNALQDFIDQQRELSGANGAKAPRFLDDNSTPRTQQEKERKTAQQERFAKTLLDLMNDPAFRAAYDRISDKIDDAQDRLNSALDKVAQRIEHLLQVKTDLEEAAVKLEDGTAIFKSQDGKIYTADGCEVPAGSLSPALLTQLDNGPSWEQYQGTTDALNGARQRQNDLSGMQDNIDDARTRRDNAKSVDDLGDVEKDIDRIFVKIDGQLSNKSDFNAQASTRPKPLDELDFSKDLSLN